MTSRTTRAGTAPRGPSHYDTVTERVLEALRQGTPPWRRPWDKSKCGSSRSGAFAGGSLPRNALTGVSYRGLNTILLSMAPFQLETGDPRWATYKQAQSKGWQVREGEKGTPAFFYKRFDARAGGGEEEDDAHARRGHAMLKCFTLFHAGQMDGVPDYAPPTPEEAPWRLPDAADTIVRESRAVIREGGDRAFYSPGTDRIQMPPRSAFATADHFVSVILHEMSHWSGAAHRLNRDLSHPFGSTEYAREELVAELSQIIVCGELGLSGCAFTNGAAYVASWLSILANDHREIFRAAAAAQRAADYILAFHPAWKSRATPAPEPANDGQDETAREAA